MRLDLIQNYTALVNGVETTFDWAIKQGSTYTRTIRFPGNYSGYTAKGEIRDNYLHAAGVVLATFGFGTLVYNATDDKTDIPLILTYTQTALLPVTKYQGTGSPSVNNALVYDIELTDTVEVVPVVDASFVQVKPQATD